MKKILAVLLAAALLVCSGGALASRLEYTPLLGTGVPIGEFREYFDNAAGKYGIPFTWDTQTRSEDVYEVYTARAEDLDMVLQVYTTDTCVDYYLFTIREKYRDDDSEAERIVTEAKAMFNASTLSLGMAVYWDEGNYTAEDVANEVTAGWKNLLKALNEEMERSDGGRYAAVGTVFDFPTGIEIEWEAEGLKMTIIVMSMDCKLWTE